MPRSMGMLAFPEFKGFTRSLVLANLAVYFLLLVLGAVAPSAAATLVSFAALSPALVLHGWVWQLVTYSFVHFGLLGTAMELLSLWFLGSFLEMNHGPRWTAQLYFVSVVGAGLAAVALAWALDPSVHAGLLLASFGYSGAFGGIFGLLIAFAVLYGDLQFTMFPLPIAIRAKYLVAIYMLIAVAQLFGASRAYALGQLGGALAGYLFIRFAPRGTRRGLASQQSEWWYRLRNNYAQWKRRQAARKFAVYMREQNRPGQAGVVDDAESRDRKGRPRDWNDKSWMN